MIEGVPLPATDDPLDAPFWQATLRGELVVQRCRACGAWRFPPRPMCPECRSSEHDWSPVSGRGRIWSFCVPHPPLLPAFAAHAPYAVVVVELEEDARLRMVGNVVRTDDGPIDQVDPARLAIGAAVRVAFRRLADDVALPQWVLL